MKKSLPAKYANTNTAIFELVSAKGVSKTVCINTFKLSPNYFTAFVGTGENYNQALATFTNEVLMKSVVDNLKFDNSSRKFLMQKLRVFDGEIELPHKRMKTAQHASDNLSCALDAYARKEIGEEALQAIRSACSIFSELQVATTLQAEVAELKKLFEEKFKK